MRDLLMDHGEELLLVITPENLVNILKKKKTRELRKFIPKNFVGFVNLYCTFGTALVFDDILGTYELSNFKVKILTDYGVLNGRVVARFLFDEYEETSWQIKQLERYVEPLSLNDFDYFPGYKRDDLIFADRNKLRRLGKNKHLKKAPRSYQYVYLVES
jgi:predicted transcriptional regulator